MDTVPQILRDRLIDLLIDDEEYLEELYLHCNFTLDFTSVGVVARSFRARFRLGEIVVALDSMRATGLVTSRVDGTWPQNAGISRLLFSLTEKGKALWQTQVEPLSKEELYR